MAMVGPGLGAQEVCWRRKEDENSPACKWGDGGTVLSLGPIASHMQTATLD